MTYQFDGDARSYEMAPAEMSLSGPITRSSGLRTALQKNPKGDILNSSCDSRYPSGGEVAGGSASVVCIASGAGSSVRCPSADSKTRVVLSFEPESMHK